MTKVPAKAEETNNVFQFTTAAGVSITVTMPGTGEGEPMVKRVTPQGTFYEAMQAFGTEGDPVQNETLKEFFLESAAAAAKARLTMRAWLSHGLAVAAERNCAPQ